MPDGSWKSVDVRCPFYRHDSPKKRTICCEGIFDRSQLTHSFRRQRDREKQLALYCCDGFRYCEIYRAIIEARYPDNQA